jgi:hypothetical protein
MFTDRTLEVPLDPRQRAMVRLALQTQAAAFMVEAGELGTTEVDEARKSGLRTHAAEYARLAQQIEEVESW